VRPLLRGARAPAGIGTLGLGDRGARLFDPVAGFVTANVFVEATAIIAERIVGP